MERLKWIEDGSLPSSRGKTVPGKTEQCVRGSSQKEENFTFIWEKKDSGKYFSDVSIP